MANPNNLNFLKYQDIQIPDINLQKQFKEYFTAGNYMEAINILVNNSQLVGKAFVANTINVISSGILALENFYNEGVTIFLSNLSNQYFVLINNLINKKQWFASIQYEKYNFVIYNDEIYMCLQTPPIGTPPTNDTYWLYLGLKGIDGAPGTNVNMQYTWNSVTTYEVNDLVVYGTNIYVALEENTNVIPDANPNTWLVFLASTPGQIYVGMNPPDYPVQNTIWFQTQSDPLLKTDTTPIIGLFNYYDDNENQWVPMYPNTLFTWVDGNNGYTQSMVEIDLNIQPIDWNNLEYTYIYQKLIENNIVSILPSSTITSEQLNVYNQLNLSIENQNIILSINSLPTVSLPVRLLIQ